MRKLLTIFIALALWVSPAALAQNPTFRAQNVTASACASPNCVTSAALKLWLKADAIVGLSNGDPVPTWTDSSGNSNTATSAGPTDLIYRTNAINTTLPAVSFGELGTSYFTFPDFASAFTAGEVYLVVKLDADPASDGSTSGLWDFGTSGSFVAVPYTDGHVYDDWGQTTRPDQGVTGGIMSSWTVYSLWSASNDYASFLNGTSLYTNGTNTVAFRTNLQLGRGLSADQHLKGKVAEMIMYNGKLSSGDRLIVKTYLHDKYGLTIARLLPFEQRRVEAGLAFAA